MNGAATSGDSTFRSRLTFTMTVLCLLVLAVTCIAVYVGVRAALLGSVDSALLAIARLEIASAVDEPGGRIHVHEEGPIGLSLRSGSGYEKFAQILQVDGHVLAQTSNLEGGAPLQSDATLRASAAAGVVTFANMRRDHLPYRGIYYPFPSPDDPQARLVALVAVPLETVQHSLESLLLILGLSMLAGSAAAALGADQLAARLTKPLERIAAAAGSIGEQSLDVRIPDAAADKELRSVTTVLNQMLARLQNAFAAQQRFISDAAHELRSPLSNLRGALEVSLRRPRSAEEYRETLEDSLREVERMTRLAHDLLLLSRAEAGALGSVETRETCDLGSLAEDAVAAHLAGAGQRGVRIDVSAPVSTPVRGDADQLREVIDNLLDNAVRYAPSGSSVQVRVQANAASAEIEVRDAGPGISATDQLHIFERFYRADRSRARDSGGTGLGLSIAKAIIAAHNGEIWVDSELGRGAAFHFRLPLAQPSPAPAATSRLERID